MAPEVLPPDSSIDAMTSPTCCPDSDMSEAVVALSFLLQLIVENNVMRSVLKSTCFIFIGPSLDDKFEDTFVA